MCISELTVHCKLCQESQDLFLCHITKVIVELKGPKVCSPDKTVINFPVIGKYSNIMMTILYV